MVITPDPYPASWPPADWPVECVWCAEAPGTICPPRIAPPLFGFALCPACHAACPDDELGLPWWFLDTCESCGGRPDICFRPVDYGDGTGESASILCRNCIHPDELEDLAIMRSIPLLNRVELA